MQTLSDSWEWLASFGAGTWISMAVGLIATLVTFWISARRTIGAAEERLRIANLDLIGSIFRRIAVEREPITAAHFKALRRAKAYRSSIDETQLLQDEEILDVVLADCMEHHLLDKETKSLVLDLIEQSRKQESADAVEREADSRVVSFNLEGVFGMIAVLSAFVGLLAFLVSLYLYRAKVRDMEAVQAALAGNKAGGTEMLLDRPSEFPLDFWYAVAIALLGYLIFAYLTKFVGLAWASGKDSMQNIAKVKINEILRGRANGPQN